MERIEQLLPELEPIMKPLLENARKMLEGTKPPESETGFKAYWEKMFKGR